MHIKSNIAIVLIILFASSCESFGLDHGLIAIERPEGRIEVGVLNPHGSFIYLYSDDFHCPGTIVDLNKIVIDPNKALGYYWDDGDRREVAVFDAQGIYEIFVSDNLETDLSEISGIRIKYDNDYPRMPGSVKSCTI